MTVDRWPDSCIPDPILTKVNVVLYCHIALAQLLDPSLPLSRSLSPLCPQKSKVWGSWMDEPQPHPEPRRVGLLGWLAGPASQLLTSYVASPSIHSHLQPDPLETVGNPILILISTRQLCLLRLLAIWRPCNCGTPSARLAFVFPECHFILINPPNPGAPSSSQPASPFAIPLSPIVSSNYPPELRSTFLSRSKIADVNLLSYANINSKRETRWCRTLHTSSVSPY